MLTSIAGKTVIVTGASKGIGRGIAKRFGVAGLNVLVVSRHLDEAKKVAGEIGANASSFAADVSEAEPCQAMAAAALERYGSIDILCANAGIFPAAKLGQMTAADFDQVIGVNLKGTFLAVSAVLPAMKARRRAASSSPLRSPARSPAIPAGRITARAKRASSASCAPRRSNSRPTISPSTR